MFEDLRWFGLEWQEGPDLGGALGPYSQSQRGAFYLQAFQSLLQHSLVYPCRCSRRDVLHALVHPTQTKQNRSTPAPAAHPPTPAPPGQHLLRPNCSSLKPTGASTSLTDRKSALSTAAKAPNVSWQDRTLATLWSGATTTFPPINWPWWPMMPRCRSPRSSEAPISCCPRPPTAVVPRPRLPGSEFLSLPAHNRPSRDAAGQTTRLVEPASFACPGSEPPRLAPGMVIQLHSKPRMTPTFA